MVDGDNIDRTKVCCGDETDEVKKGTDTTSKDGKNEINK